MASRDFRQVKSPKQQEEKAVETPLARALIAAEDANRTGTSTLNQLATQREQLERMNEDLHETDESLSKSEWVLRGMKSWAGAITNWFSSEEKIPSSYPGDSTSDSLPSAALASPSSAAASSAATSDRSAYDQRSRPGLAATKTPEAETPVAAAPERELSPEELEQERIESQQLDQLSALVSNMHGLAQTMNGEIKHQGALLRQVDRGVNHNSMRIKKQIGDMRSTLE